MNKYVLSANSVFLAHVFFILFAIFGGVFFFFEPYLVILHALVFSYVVLLLIFDGECFLTNLEISLRRRAGQDVQWNTFVDHYIYEKLGIAMKGSSTLILYAVAAGVINGYCYYQAIRLWS